MNATGTCCYNSLLDERCKFKYPSAITSHFIFFWNGPAIFLYSCCCTTGLQSTRPTSRILIHFIVLSFNWVNCLLRSVYFDFYSNYLSAPPLLLQSTLRCFLGNGRPTQERACAPAMQYVDKLLSETNHNAHVQFKAERNISSSVS